MNTETDPHGLKAEYEAYQQASWDQQHTCMNYPEWLEMRFDELVQALQKSREAVTRAQSMLDSLGQEDCEAGLMIRSLMPKLDELLGAGDWSPAPPAAPIALSDAEIVAAEAEDRDYQTCHQCGQLSEDCQCESGSEE